MRTWISAIAVVIASTPALAKNPPDPPAATWTAPPPPGVETVKPAAPTWCAGYKPKPWLPGNLVYDDIKDGYSEEVLGRIAELACDRPDDPGRQAWIAFYRQGWLNIVGTTERQDREAMAARLHFKEEHAKLLAMCKPLFTRDDERSPAENELDLLRAEALGCLGVASQVMASFENDSLPSASYWIDRAAEPPDELVRVAFVLRCFNTGASSVEPKSVINTLGNHAFCGHDARKLDRAAFDKAVAARKLPPLGRARAAEMFAYTTKLLASYDEAYKALIAKDKDYAKVIVDAPEQGFAEWQKTRDANAAALDAALAMEDKFREGDKRAVAGCSTSLRKQLQDHVRERAPKTKEDAVDAVNDDVGQPVLRALIACDSLEGRHGLVETEFTLLGMGRERRGPRTSAFWHTLDLVVDLAKDKPKFVQPPQFGAPLPSDNGLDSWMHHAYTATFNQTAFDKDQKGQVATVSPKGDGVTITFKHSSYQEPVLDCHDTNRIDRITPDGKLEYRQSCAFAGMKTVNDTPPPAWIRKDLAEGIKPGVFLELRLDHKPKPDEGFPKEVFADQGHKHLIAYWGYAVKH